MASDEIIQLTICGSVAIKVLHWFPSEWKRRFTPDQRFDDTAQVQHLFGHQFAQRRFWSNLWHRWVEKWRWKTSGKIFILFLYWYKLLFLTASPHTSSTPNINSVRHADSRGSLISTDSGNSLPERNNDKGNSLDKVHVRKCCKVSVK